MLRNIGGREAADLRRGIEAMKRDVRARSVPLAELRGQTITLSNFGMFGGRFAALVIVPPRLRSSAPTASPVILAAKRAGRHMAIVQFSELAREASWAGPRE